MAGGASVKEIKARKRYSCAVMDITTYEMLQITVEYSSTPPQVFVSHMRQFCMDHQSTNCHISLEWEKKPIPPREDTGEKPTEPEQG